MKQTEYELHLIEQIYEATLNPLSFDQFARDWVEFLQQVDAPSQDLLVHIQQANSMLIQFGQSEQLNTSSNLNNHLPMFQVDSEGNPHSANASARSLLESADVSYLLKVAREIAVANDQQLTRVVMPIKDAADITMIVSNFARHRIENGSANVTATQMLWPDNFDPLLQDQFGLGNVEVSIVRALVEGKSTRQIAEDRNRAFETVRTQVRTILKKVGVDNQLDLVRTVLGLLETASAQQLPVGEQTSWGTRRHRSMAGGALFTYLDLGPGGGKPCLLLLDSEFETDLPEELLKCLVNSGRRVIVPRMFHHPWQPSEILPQLGIDHVQVLSTGRSVAAVLADNAASSMPITELIALNVPQVTAGGEVNSADWIQYLVALTASRAAPALEFVVRARGTYIKRIGEEEYAKGYFSPSKADTGLLNEGFKVKLPASASHEASIADFAANLGRQCAELEVINDKPFQIRYLNGSEAIGTRSAEHSIQNAGQLLLYTHASAVFAAVNQELA